jgi:hypothetical protein
VLDRSPGACRQINAFLDLLDEALGLGADDAEACEKHRPATHVEPESRRLAEPGNSPATDSPPGDHAETSGTGDAHCSGDDPPAVDAASAPHDPNARRGWIPILGHSAAGVPAFWADPALAEDVVELADLIERHGQAVRQARRAATVTSSEAGPNPTALVTLTSPDGSEAAEYVVAEDLRQRYPDAFALRIDGRSMAPELEHGDVVVLSPSSPALPGRPAVVQLKGQIGVTCKLYRPAGNDVHLVAIDPDTPPARARGEDVVWAFRVLGRVRPAGGER